MARTWSGKRGELAWLAARQGNKLAWCCPVSINKTTTMPTIARESWINRVTLISIFHSNFDPGRLWIPPFVIDRKGILRTLSGWRRFFVFARSSRQAWALLGYDIFGKIIDLRKVFLEIILLSLTAKRNNFLLCASCIFSSSTEITRYFIPTESIRFIRRGDKIYLSNKVIN